MQRVGRIKRAATVQCTSPAQAPLVLVARLWSFATWPHAPNLINKQLSQQQLNESASFMTSLDRCQRINKAQRVSKAEMKWIDHCRRFVFIALLLSS